MSSEQSRLRILGIDPGSRKTGFAVVEVGTGRRCRVVESGVLSVPSGLALASRFAWLAREIESVIGRSGPRLAVVESLFRGINPRSLIVLAQARGALLASISRAGVPVCEYTPAEIKSAITGNGRADKQMVARMVSLSVVSNRPAKMGADETDALAAALCLVQRYRHDVASGRIVESAD